MPDTAVMNPTPEAPAANPAPTQDPAPASSGTVQQNGSDAAGAAPSEESFYSGDPNSLPPELQQAYKNMLKDYKMKTTSVADMRKKAEAFDKVTSRSDFKDWWGNANKQQKAEFKDQKAEVEKTLGQKITDERFQKAFETKDGFLELIAEVAKEIGGKSQAEIQDLKKQVSLKESQDLTQSFATEVGKDGKVIRPDFDDLEENSLISGYLAVNKPENGTAQAQLAKLNEAYSWAQSVSKKYFEKGKAEGLQIMQQKAATSTERPTQAAKGAYTGSDPKKLSASDAYQLAKKGIRVPRDD